jgi:Domain of Unknown Function (DUF1080)
MLRLIAALALAALVAGCASTTDLLANGLAGLDRTGQANWTFANGVAQADSGPGPSLLVTKQDYRDFELTLEVFVSVDHNSGVFIRCSDRSNLTATNCYEVNIFDKRPDQTGRTGGAPGYFKPLAQVDFGGKWNTILIQAKGPHILAVFNGVTTIDNDGPLLANGPIALQWGAGEVKFRNVRIRRLD